MTNSHQSATGILLLPLEDRAGHWGEGPPAGAAEPPPGAPGVPAGAAYERRAAQRARLALVAVEERRLALERGVAGAVGGAVGPGDERLGRRDVRLRDAVPRRRRRRRHPGPLCAHGGGPRRPAGGRVLDHHVARARPPAGRSRGCAMWSGDYTSTAGKAPEGATLCKRALSVEMKNSASVL